MNNSLSLIELYLLLGIGKKQTLKTLLFPHL